jgi:hypothetical protein
LKMGIRPISCPRFKVQGLTRSKGHLYLLFLNSTKEYIEKLVTS